MAPLPPPPEAYGKPRAAAAPDVAGQALMRMLGVKLQPSTKKAGAATLPPPPGAPSAEEQQIMAAYLAQKQAAQQTAQ